MDVFFVLSGYLITWLLVNEAETSGRIDYVRFYARRARRLLPALTVMLFVTMALTAVIFAPFEHDRVAQTAIATAAYLSNVFFARNTTNYLAAQADTNPLLHTWTLAVEEQFYIIWPFFILLALRSLLKRNGEGKPARSRLIGWLVAVTILSFAGSAWLTYEREAWAFFHSPARAWEFSAGALALLLPRTKLEAGARTAIAWLGLAGILAAGMLFGETTRFPGFAALLPVISTILVLRAGALPETYAPGALLGTPALQRIGALSYSWYLWHWPILVFAVALGDAANLPLRLAAVLLSLLIAIASYRFIENPIRRSRWIMLRPRMSLAFAAIVAVCGVASGFAWRDLARGWRTDAVQVGFEAIRDDVPAINDPACDDWYHSAEVKVCAFGPAEAARTVVLFGDSRAGMWFPAVEAIADERGWRLLVITKSACPAASVSYFNELLGRTFRECDDWRPAVLARIAQIRPFLTLVSTASNYPFDDEQWREGTSRLLASLSSSSRNVIVIRDTPWADDLPACLARREWLSRLIPTRTSCVVRGLEPENEAAYASQAAAAKGFQNVAMLDLTDLVCMDEECPVETFEVVPYRDPGHITATFSRLLSLPVGTAIDSLLPQK